MSLRYSPVNDQEALVESAENQQRISEQLHPTDMQLLITPRVDDNSRWMHVHTSNGSDYFHPMSSSTFSGMPMTTMSPFTSGEYVGEGLYNSGLVAASMPMFNPSAPGQVWAPVTDFPMQPLSQPELVPGTNLAPSLPPARQQSSAQPSASDPSDCGILDPETRTWTCRYPSCSSKAIFNRPCDLRKHFNRHSKNFFCRWEGCSQEGGFSSKKDRLRHESKHNPGVNCEWDGCERVFSRVDNMRNHMSRIHLKLKPGSSRTSAS